MTPPRRGGRGTPVRNANQQLCIERGNDIPQREPYLSYGYGPAAFRNEPLGNDDLKGEHDDPHAHHPSNDLEQVELP